MHDLCYKAMELNTKFSSILIYSRYPIQFLANIQGFIPTVSKWQLTPWYITAICFAGLLWTVSLNFEILYRGVFLKTDDYNRLFFNYVLFTPYVLCNGINLAVYTKRVEISKACNILYTLHDSFFPRYKSQKPKGATHLILKELKKLKNPKQWNHIDGVGLLGTYLVFLMSFEPFMFLVGALYTGKDPITLSYQDLFYFNRIPESLKIYGRLFTISIVFVIFMEACRVCRVVFVMVMVNTKFTLAMTEALWRKSERKLDAGIRDYIKLYYVHVQSFQSAGPLIFVIIEGGMLIAIFSLAGTFVGWKIVSPYFYWMCPIMAGLTLAIFSVAVSYATKSAERSTTMLDNWKYRMGLRPMTKYKRFQMKRLRALNGMKIVFWAENFGWVTKEGKNRMFSTILFNTIDAVLILNI